MTAPSRRSAAAGFTLVELMTVLFVASILLAVTIPSFSQLIAQQRVRTAASALTEALWLARAEATKRNTDVSFTFVSVAGGWTLPDPVDAAHNPPLLTQDGFPALVSTTPGGTTVQFNFNAYGRLSSGGNSWIQLGDARTGIYRCVSVSTTGRASTKDGTCP